jgi:hypothetical protein
MMRSIHPMKIILYNRLLYKKNRVCGKTIAFYLPQPIIKPYCKVIRIQMYIKFKRRMYCY